MRDKKSTLCSTPIKNTQHKRTRKKKKKNVQIRIKISLLDSDRKRATAQIWTDKTQPSRFGQTKPNEQKGQLSRFSQTKELLPRFGQTKDYCIDRDRQNWMSR